MIIMQEWLKNCDSHDFICRPRETKSGLKTIPTRVIDVGVTGAESVHLRETNPGDVMRWVALSHPWGAGPFYYTTCENLAMLLSGIPEDSLPATFRDAIAVTRALGIRYLWIDALCIVYGPDGDRTEEVQRMETVFSGAYCVLAASRASSHRSGFLGPRKARDVVTLRQQDDIAPFYICEMIDDFKVQVLDGPLNSRAWAMQEHALARRTLFFTEHQTYWECGDGIRCETQTKMWK